MVPIASESERQEKEPERGYRKKYKSRNTSDSFEKRNKKSGHQIYAKKKTPRRRREEK